MYVQETKGSAKKMHHPNRLHNKCAEADRVQATVQSHGMPACRCPERVKRSARHMCATITTKGTDPCVGGATLWAVQLITDVDAVIQLPQRAAPGERRRDQSHLVVGKLRS